MGGILCPEDAGEIPTCPDGEPCICIDVDGSCTDGDDDWGYEDHDNDGHDDHEGHDDHDGMMITMDTITMVTDQPLIG